MDKLFSIPQVVTSAIEYQNNAIVSKTILQNTAGNITLFAFDKGQSLSEHTAPYDAFVMVLDGVLEINIGGTVHKVSALQSIGMPANMPHGLVAVEKAKMLLVMIKG